MKTRIFGSLFVLLILLGLFFVSESVATDKEQPATQNQIVPSSNDAAMKSLSIN